MTTLIATSVVRGSHQGESHGGVYLVDLAREHTTQVLDWNRGDIDWQGRGWDRGLRGIDFDDDRVYIGASDELFCFSPQFERIGSFGNPYLKHCHEICRHERRLYLTSTGFDAILGFDLDRERFSFGLHISAEGGEFRATPFDPNAAGGPPFRNTLHLNSVVCTARGMYISGMRTGALLVYDGYSLGAAASLPQGVHNARPFGTGIVFNDTRADCVRYVTPEHQCAFPVPRHAPESLTHTDLDDTRIARQAFGRGLCTLSAGTIAAGSSPSTIAVHDLTRLQTVKLVMLSRDLRNAIHGLEVWPF
ncbi:MAG: hypothetical protein IT495_09940 [Gammaproteobacteria bacterium]|nr:hypothetical protein [Gammaproteobacteria bacterium]